MDQSALSEHLFNNQDWDNHQVANHKRWMQRQVA